MSNSPRSPYGDNLGSLVDMDSIRRELAEMDPTETEQLNRRTARRQELMQTTVADDGPEIPEGASPEEVEVLLKTHQRKRSRERAARPAVIIATDGKVYVPPDQK